jgi:hypothetical protein
MQNLGLSSLDQCTRGQYGNGCVKRQAWRKCTIVAGQAPPLNDDVAKNHWALKRAELSGVLGDLLLPFLPGEAYLLDSPRAVL